MTRIEAGSASPSFDLAQEILTVLGEPIGFTGLADRDAIAAARLALDPVLDIAVNAGVQAWRECWARIGLVDRAGAVVAGQRASLLFRASTAARLSRRAGAADFLYSASAGEVWPGLYVADVAAAAKAVGLAPRPEGTYGARITLIPFNGLCELERVEIDGTTVAALDQVVLDCYGGTGRMAEQADILMGRRQSGLRLGVEPAHQHCYSSQSS